MPTTTEPALRRITGREQTCGRIGPARPFTRVSPYDELCLTIGHRHQRVGSPRLRRCEMFLALREIRRARWRFALLTGAVGLLVFLILFVQALTGALIGQFIGALDHQSADVLVYSAQARKNLEGSVVPPVTVEAVANVPTSLPLRKTVIRSET